MKLYSILIDDGAVQMPTMANTSALDVDMLLAARSAVGELRGGAEVAEVAGVPGVQITRTAPGWIADDLVSEGTLLLSSGNTAFMALVAIAPGQPSPLETLKALVGGTRRPSTARDPFFGIAINTMKQHAPAVAIVSRDASKLPNGLLPQALHLAYCLADAVLSVQQSGEAQAGRQCAIAV